MRPRQPFDPETWQVGRRELVVQSWIGGDHSFGVVSRSMIEALERADVTPILGPSVKEVPSQLERLRRPSGHGSRLTLLYQAGLLPRQLDCERLVYYLPWESTLMPLDQIEYINRYAYLAYVPCRQNLESYVDRGAKAPTRILHYGVDPTRFPNLEQDKREFSQLAGSVNNHRERGSTSSSVTACLAIHGAIIATT